MILALGAMEMERNQQRAHLRGYRGGEVARQMLRVRGGASKHLEPQPRQMSTCRCA